MKLLREATARGTAELADIEHEARTLLSELDTLEVRLHRAFDAVSIDKFVAYLNIERKGILEDEKRAKAGTSLAGFPVLGIYGLFSLFSGRKPNWDRAIPVAFAKEPFEDVRVVVSENNVELVNVSKMARERDMSVAGVVAYLEGKGHRLLSWLEFEAKARGLRTAALKGKLIFPDKEEPAKLQMKVHDSPRLIARVIP